MNGDCIDRDEMCDGKFDCSDLSDESEVCMLPPYSETETHICNQTEFTCGNRECIKIDKVCDMKADCTDSTDENSTMCKFLNMMLNFTYYMRSIIFFMLLKCVYCYSSHSNYAQTIIYSISR